MVVSAPDMLIGKAVGAMVSSCSALRACDLLTTPATSREVIVEPAIPKCGRKGPPGVRGVAELPELDGFVADSRARR